MDHGAADGPAAPGPGPAMQTRRTKKLLFAGVWLAALACLWLYLAPVDLGGSTTYVVTDGTSMEPQFHAGDLALIRSQDSYRVGDVVAYRSNAFHTIVLHRIVRIAGAHYVFKGDNNNFLDFEHPTGSQLIGALWLHIPGVGSRLESLRSPELVGILIAVATLLLSGAAFTKRRARRRRRRAAAAAGTAGTAAASQAPPRRRRRRSSDPVIGVLAAGLVALLPFVALALLAFTRPATALLPFEVPYKQSGTLSYTAGTAPGPIYPGNRAVTGEPLFTHVVSSVQLRFRYRLGATAAAHRLAGRASLQASVTSTNGWHTSFQLHGPTAFHGDVAALTASLDLHSLLALLRRVDATTGVSGSYTLTLIPRVSVGGSLDAVPLHTTFSPRFRFAVNQLEVQPAATAGGSANAAAPAASQFVPSAGGSATGLRYQPYSLSLKVTRLPVATARRIALGGVATVVCVMLATLALLRPRRRDEAETILARYGRSIVAVERVWQLPGAPVIDVADFDALLRIAAHYDRTILYEVSDACEAFWVTDESGQFRYAVGASAESAVIEDASLEPVREWTPYGERDAATLELRLGHPA
jgi:signal peptidase I